MKSWNTNGKAIGLKAMDDTACKIKLRYGAMAEDESVDDAD